MCFVELVRFQSSVADSWMLSHLLSPLHPPWIRPGHHTGITSDIIISPSHPPTIHGHRIPPKHHGANWKGGRDCSVGFAGGNGRGVTHILYIHTQTHTHSNSSHHPLQFIVIANLSWSLASWVCCLCAWCMIDLGHHHHGKATLVWNAIIQSPLHKTAGGSGSDTPSSSDLF